jgi:general secretion pathway protein L
MPETFVIRIQHDVEPATWTVLDEYGRPLGAENSGPLSAAAAAAGDRRVMLLVPAIDVLLSSATIPVKGRARQLKMVPFSLEEGLAADIESLHFAIGDADSNDAIPVAIVDRELLHSWHAEVSQAGLKVASIYSDAEGVPDTPGTLTVVVDAECIYVKPPGEPAVSLDGGDLVQALGLSLPEASYPQTHLLIYGDPGHLDQHASYLSSLRERMASLDVHALADGVLQRLGATLLAGGGIDLLQGDLAPRSDWLGLLKHWRTAASLAAGFVLVAMLAQGAEYWNLQRRSAALEEAVDQTCRRVFPGSTPQTCRQQVRESLAVRGANNAGPAQPFLPTLAAVGGAIDGKSKLQALDYRGGVTNLRVLAPDVATLDSIQRAMASSGLIEVEIQSANPVDGGVEGRLQARGKVQ